MSKKIVTFRFGQEDVNNLVEWAGNNAQNMSETIRQMIPTGDLKTACIRWAGKGGSPAAAMESLIVDGMIMNMRTSPKPIDRYFFDEISRDWCERFDRGETTTSPADELFRFFNAWLDAASADPEVSEFQTLRNLNNTPLFLESDGEEKKKFVRGTCGTSNYYLAKPPTGGKWEKMGVTGWGVLKKNEQFTADGVERTAQLPDEDYQ